QMIDTRYHEGGEHLAIRGDTANGNPTEPHAVISALPANEAHPRCIASHAVIADSNLQRRIDGLGAGVHEEHAVLGASAQCCNLARKRKGFRVTHLEPGREVESTYLSANCFDDTRV